VKTLQVFHAALLPAANESSSVVPALNIHDGTYVLIHTCTARDLLICTCTARDLLIYGGGSRHQRCNGSSSMETWGIVGAARPTAASSRHLFVGAKGGTSQEPRVVLRMSQGWYLAGAKGGTWQAFRQRI
jgi:hypothetical protein